MSGEIKVTKVNTHSYELPDDIEITVKHRLGDFERWLLMLALFAAVAVATSSCAHTPHVYIPDPVSMELWTDAPGEPDPLAECHRVTGAGACVVSSARAWAWWMARWQACEEKLENEKEEN